MANFNVGHPHVRRMNSCLRCGGHKMLTALVCWTCHNELKLIYGGGPDNYGPETRELLDSVEHMLVEYETLVSRERDRVCRKPDATC